MTEYHSPRAWRSTDDGKTWEQCPDQIYNPGIVIRERVGANWKEYLSNKKKDETNE